MDLLHPRVEEYLQELAEHGDPLLQRMEERALSPRFPILGPVAGKFCYLVARMMKAQRIFEMGSGYGYSTLWFARAVVENGGGEVYHTVWDEGLSQDARGYLAEAGVDHLIRYHVGESVAALRETPGPFDLIFNDIDKHGYPASIPVVKEKLRPGGVMIIDNMLYYGRIFDPENQHENTIGVREVTRLIFGDPDFEASLIPIRDGMIVAVKK